MGIFDFLSGSNKSKVYRVSKSNYWVNGDVVPNDRVKLWKPNGKTIISFYDKEIDILIGKLESKVLAKMLDDGVEYRAKVQKVSGNIVHVEVKLLENLESKEEYKKNESIESDERFKRINQRFEEEKKIAEEKRALVQPEYDKVLLKHQTKLDDFEKQISSLKKEFNQAKLNKLKVVIEKEVEKIESKYNKRDEIFWDRTDKWQESEKGQLYEDISDELNDLQCDLESLLENDIPELMKNQE